MALKLRVALRCVALRCVALRCVAEGPHCVLKKGVCPQTEAGCRLGLAPSLPQMGRGRQPLFLEKTVAIHFCTVLCRVEFAGVARSYGLRGGN